MNRRIIYLPLSLFMIVLLAFPLLTGCELFEFEDEEEEEAPALPVIDVFESEPTEEGFVLSWSVKGATEAQINGSKVGSTGTMLVQPTEPTKYTLITTNEAGSVSQTVTLVPVPTAPVYLSLPYQEAGPGEEVTISVEVRPEDWGVSAGEINLGFEPAIMHVIDLEPGDLLGSDPLVGVSDIDNEAGTLRYALARRGPTTVATPAGAFVRIRLGVLEGAEGGMYRLTLTKVGLADENFEDIEDLEFEGASIRVIGY